MTIDTIRNERFGGTGRQGANRAPRRRTIAVVLLAALMATAPFASTPVSADGQRDVTVNTPDERGVMKVRITWVKNKKLPYFHGDIVGSVTDLEEDGMCIAAFTRGRTKKERRLDPQIDACPAGMSQPIRHHFKNTRDVQVKVCAVRNGRQVACSPWR
jgi:hypothetical protein